MFIYSIEKDVKIPLFLCGLPFRKISLWDFWQSTVHTANNISVHI